MSYIEREAVLDRLAKVNMDTYYGFTAAVQFGVDHAIRCIKEAPAADVVEVRHGRWGEYESFPLTSSLNGHPCSECGMHFSTLAIPVMKYCPNCGARMDKEDKHEAD